MNLYTVYQWDGENRCYQRVGSGFNYDMADSYLVDGGFFVDDVVGKILDVTQNVWNQSMPLTAFRRQG